MTTFDEFLKDRYMKYRPDIKKLNPFFPLSKLVFNAFVLTGILLPKTDFNIDRADFEEIKSLLAKFKSQNQFDNFCYIIEYLRSEKKEIDFRRTQGAANYYKTLESDKNQLLNHFRDVENMTNDHSPITSVSFNTKKPFKNFKISNPIVMKKILKVIYEHYGSNIIENESLKGFLNEIKTGEPVEYGRILADKIFQYLTNNTSLGKNEKYYTVGILFCMGHIDEHLSPGELDNIQNNKGSETSYDNYYSYVVKNVRNKYF